MFARYVSAPVVWLLVSLAVAVVALVVVAVALLTKHKTEAAASGEPRAASASQEWIGAVCKRGTYQNGKGGNTLTGSAGSALCYGNSRGTILIGTYESEFRFENAAANFTKQSEYATLTDDSGQLWVFYSYDGAADLSPLSGFGFALHRG
jgi:hypothetical protein